jgi:hypothetical protein
VLIHQVSNAVIDRWSIVMASEKEWVQTLQPRLELSLQGLASPDLRAVVEGARKLPYACEILRYRLDDRPDHTYTAKYETDLLVYDQQISGEWVPRVIIECKLGSVTTHDALTYSAKAATHKQVHPYLRYGILIGDYGTSVPGRLIRHGAHFDFMMVWRGADAIPEEWSAFVEILTEEVKGSRTLQQLMTDRSHDRKVFRVLHRRLEFK